QASKADLMLTNGSQSVNRPSFPRSAYRRVGQVREASAGPPKGCSRLVGRLSLRLACPTLRPLFPVFLIRGHGQRVATFVLGVAAVAADVGELDRMLGRQGVELTPEVFVLDFLEVAAFATLPAVELPLGHPLGKALEGVDAVADDF